MQIKLNSLNKIVVFIYILVVFFILPTKYNFIADILFIIAGTGLILITWLSKTKSKQNINFKVLDLLQYLFVGLVFIFILIFSQYSKTYITSNLFFLILLIYFFYRDNLKVKNGSEEWFYNFFYYLMCISLVVQIILSYKMNGSISLIIGWDKNYTGVILFLFFAFCYKRNKSFGILLSLISAAFLDSRGFILMIALFYSILIFRSPIYNLLKTFIFKKMFRILTFLLIFICAFSYFWVYSIASQGTVDYQEGLNDGSNKMRFVANIKTFELIKENKNIVFYGFDNDLKKELGIESDNYSSHPRYLGARLVQTHNSILSIIIKTGFMFSFIYLLILSKILDKYFVKENIEYIFPFLASSMIMHSLLNTSLLLFWVLILHLPQKGNFGLKINFKPSLGNLKLNKVSWKTR
ncbi:hypothetical protein J7E71_12170 [Mesobacillus foraminis]|uniref:hypothetical protein n=1 Tax=Mesobacillus foraminis TaxID=279826 RepID=UPI001BE7175E|nr:hypothetical protein [Mesobacillus foraminis]MBT2756711.1 hypothetical protein [Mesobacillus foraminis]